MEDTSLWSSLLQALENEGFFYWSELLAVITGIFYVVLAARNNPWCWFWGMLSAALWTYAAFVVFDLYVDALLQVFYVIMAAWGWYRWTKGNAGKELSITSIKKEQHLLILVGGTLLAFVIGYLFDEYTQAAATYLDAFTTVFSVLATLMVVQRKLENWLYWIGIDLVYCYLYYSRGGYLFAGLFVIYTIIAIIGYWNWKREKLESASA